MEQQKHTAESIMELVMQLPIVERTKIHRLLTDMPEGTSELEEYLAEQRFYPRLFSFFKLQEKMNRSKKASPPLYFQMLQ